MLKKNIFEQYLAIFVEINHNCFRVCESYVEFMLFSYFHKK